LADIFISHSSNDVAPVDELVQIIEGGIGSTTTALSVCANSAQRVENPWDRSSPILSPTLLLTDMRELPAKGQLVLKQSSYLLKRNNTVNSSRAVRTYGDDAAVQR
jgi:hypothetical protein